MGRIFGRIADYIRECDKIMLIIVFASSCFGAFAVLSATRYTGSSEDFYVQLLALFLGLGVAIIISLIDYAHFLKYWYIAAAIGFIPVILTFFIGFAPAGTDDKAWLRIFGFSFQPSELLKMMFLITFAAHLDKVKDTINKPRTLIPLCLHGFAPAVLVHFQGDDGTALVFAVMAVGMMYAAGLHFGYFLAAFGAAIVASPFIYFFVMNDDQRSRIINMFDINADIQGAGYQQYRARVALAGGGFAGQGYMKGELTQVGGVPESYNDFIFTSIGEELGFLGCIVVLILLCAIAFRALSVGKMCHKKAGTFMCVGFFSMMLVHIVINVGMNISVLPVIGITLPFFSAGGTSLLCMFVGVGIMLSVYSHRNSRTIYLRDNY